MEDALKPNHHKRSWPELVGWRDLVAGFKIINDRPDVTVVVFKLGETPEPGFHSKRVCVFVNPDRLVALVPKIG